MARDSLKRSAIAVAFLRAIATNSSDTKLFEDPYAEFFLPKRYGWLAKRERFLKRFARRVEIMESNSQTRYRRQFWRIMTQVLLRARYTEEVLHNRILEGVKQYIILGAGMDTFIFRRTDLLQSIRVFELDLPSTQQLKLRRVERAHLDVPSNVYFLPIDFEKSSVVDVLKASEFDPKLPTLIGWNGVTYYLPKKVIASMLRELSDYMGENVEIVFDYADGRLFNRSLSRWWQKLLRYLYRQTREPLITGFDLEELESLLEESGFTMVKHCAGKELGDLYSREVLGIFQPSKFMHFAHIKGVCSAGKSDTEINNVA